MPSSFFNRFGSARQKWQEKADNGDVNAQFSVGRGLFDGGGGYPKSQEEGLHYLEMAAKQGHRMAKLRLGDIYFDGVNGVHQDYYEAAFWYNSLASGGDGSAMYKLYVLYKKGCPPHMEPNKRLALEWLLKAHAHKHPGCEAAIVKLRNDLEEEEEKDHSQSVLGSEQAPPSVVSTEQTPSVLCTDLSSASINSTRSFADASAGLTCEEKSHVLDLLFCHSNEPTDEASALKFHEELVEQISNFPELKFYYTWLRASVLRETLSLSSAKSLLSKTLESVVPHCIDEDATIQYKLILGKCRADKMLSEEDYLRYDNRAELTQIQHVDWMIDMKQAITTNTQRLDGLDGTVEAMMANIGALDSNIRRLQDSLAYKMRMEAGASMIKAVLNAVSFGVAGEMAQLAAVVFNKIVDFGDAGHMFQIIEDNANTSGKQEEGEQLAADLKMGVELASGLVDASIQEATDRNLKKALDDRKAFVAIGFVATAMQASVPPPTEPSGPGFEELWPEAIFNEDKEDSGLELHCSVKFGDKETIEYLLNDMPMEKLSSTDSLGRSAADLAAFTGQTDLVGMLVKHGIPLKKLHKSKMKMMVEKRGELAKKYLQWVEDSVSPSERPGQFEMYNDAIFDEDQEADDLGLHCSVKFLDKDELTQMLSSMSTEAMNKVDSRGRTAADLAALTGQIDLVSLLEEHGLPLSKHISKMKAIARKRSKLLKEYRKWIWEEV